MNEQSRKFVTAARVVEMSEKRVVEMRERKEVRLVELRAEAENRIKEEHEAATRAEREEEKRLSKEKDKEERLRKQREASRKKRDEDRAKKEREDEARRARAEEARIAKIQEAERKAALTPEEREAEDKILFEKQLRDREEALVKARELEEELLGAAEGRGARKKRRTEGSALEEEAAKALSGLGGGFGLYTETDFDELDELEGDYQEPGPSRPRSSKSKARPRQSGGYDYGYGAPPHGYYPPGPPYAPYPYPYPPPPVALPPDAYVGPDGQYYDSHGQHIPFTPYPPPPGYGGPGEHAYGPPHGYPGPHYGYPPEQSEEGDYVGEEGDEGDEDLPMTGKGSRNPKVLATKRWRAIEDHERRVWTQIAKRDIPKVRRSRFAVVGASTDCGDRAGHSCRSAEYFKSTLFLQTTVDDRRPRSSSCGPEDQGSQGRSDSREEGHARGKCVLVFGPAHADDALQMLVFMKGNEKKERESRKKAEKEALDKAKKEEDLREAKRAARKLNFLITQTELYSHFVGNKIKSGFPESRLGSMTDAFLSQRAKRKIRATLLAPLPLLFPRRARRSSLPSPLAMLPLALNSRSSTSTSVSPSLVS